VHCQQAQDEVLYVEFALAGLLMTEPWFEVCKPYSKGVLEMNE